MKAHNQNTKELILSNEEKMFPAGDCFRLFENYTKEYSGLVISSIDPGTLSSQYKLNDVQFIHMTDKPNGNNDIMPKDLYKLKQFISDFLVSNPKSVILIDGLEQLIKQHEWSFVRKFLQHLTEQCPLKFERLLISLDSGEVDQNILNDLKKIMSDTYVQLVIETLSNTIRREVLYYLENNSPTTFMTVMKALELRESPKLSFHLRKLVQNQFIESTNDSYQLTNEGVKALKILKHLETEGLFADQNNTVIFERRPT